MVQIQNIFYWKDWDLCEVKEKSYVYYRLTQHSLLYSSGKSATSQEQWLQKFQQERKEERARKAKLQLCLFFECVYWGGCLCVCVNIYIFNMAL